MKKLWIVILCIFLAGAVFMTTGFALGAKRIMYIDNSGVHITANDSGVTTTVADDMDLAPYTNIDVSVYSFDIEFISADAYGLQITCDSGRNITWSDDAGTLTITENSRSGWRWFNIDLYNLFKSFAADPIKIYVPDSAKFGSVAVKNISGNVTIPRMNGTTIDLGVVSGEINIANVNATNLSASLTSGNLTMDTVTANTCSFGMVSGNVNIMGLNSQTCTGTSVSGGVTVSGDIKSAINISTISGGVRLNLAGKYGDYAKSLHATSGGVRINGTPSGNMNEPGSENTLRVSTTSGNIDITFEDR